MARTSNLTETLIHETARKLDAGGTKPTIRAIRDALGEGSLTTIANFMQTYEPENVQGAIEAPEWPESLQATWSAVWRDCYAAAHSMFDEERQALMESVRRSEATAADLGATADDLADELEKARAEIHALQCQISTLEMERDDLKLRYSELSGEYRGAQQIIEMQSGIIATFSTPNAPVVTLEIEQDGIAPAKKKPSPKSS